MWRLRAVTCMRFLSRFSLILGRLGSMPTAQLSLNARQESLIRRMLSSTAWTMTGLNTLSWKLPWLPAKPTVASLPKTRVATIVMASHWVGLTLPGMMLEPGSFSGMLISPMPLRGPEANQRTSLAIFMSAPARVRSEDDVCTRASWALNAANLFAALRNAYPVSASYFLAARSPNFGWALRRVPNAVRTL